MPLPKADVAVGQLPAKSGRSYQSGAGADGLRNSGRADAGFRRSTNDSLLAKSLQSRWDMVSDESVDRVPG